MQNVSRNKIVIFQLADYIVPITMFKSYAIFFVVSFSKHISSSTPLVGTTFWYVHRTMLPMHSLF